MNRSRAYGIAVAAVAILLIAWIARNTYWGEVTLPIPPRGEAARNPFYAAQRFTEALGATSTWDRVFRRPPADAVIVASALNWSLSRSRQQAIIDWVESGGRLVVDRSLLAGGDEFEEWAGIQLHIDEPAEDEDDSDDAPYSPCRRLFEQHAAPTAGSRSGAQQWLCGMPPRTSLTTTRPALWTLRDASGAQAIRVAAGDGFVTVINAQPFRYRSLFDGDHGWLLVTAAQLRRGDSVHFLSEDDHPSLVALIWDYGSPAVMLGLLLIGLILWRGAPRFGPPLEERSRARRSLAEQIRGTGRFVLRYGGGEALHAAAVRALDERARRAIPGYDQMPPDARIAAVARLARFEPSALGAAVHHGGLRRPHELRGTLALLETARRRMLVHPSRLTHGTH